MVPRVTQGLLLREMLEGFSDLQRRLGRAQTEVASGLRLQEPSDDPSGTAQLNRLRSELAYTSAPQIIQRGLHEFVDNLQQRLNDVGDSIHEAFFALRPLETMSQNQSQRQYQEMS